MADKFKEDVQKILEVAVNAPSGSNSQPWSFELRGNQVFVIAYPEKDHPILNYRNRGTWIAHGALLENILIAAARMGYKAVFKLFPDKVKPNLVAVLDFEPSTAAAEPLYDAIPKRATNRKPYDETKPLFESQLLEFLRTAGEIDGVEFSLVHDEAQMKLLGAAVSVNEVVMFEHKELHQLFFEELVWTEDEEKRRGGGLYFKTMELKPPQDKALKIFKHWWAMKVLNKLGLARMIAKGNAVNYASCSAMGLVVVGDSDEDFVRAGRLIERVWLKAVKMGLSMHLITGIFFFWQRIMAGLTKEFSPKHIELIKKAYQDVAGVFGVKKGVITALLRIGYGGEPTARSSKKPPVIDIVH